MPRDDRGRALPDIRPWEAEAEAMWDDGETAKVIALKFGVTKNTVVGLARRRGWTPKESTWIGHQRGPGSNKPRSSTLFTRLDAIHAKFDAVMKELNRNKALYRAAE